MCTSSSLFFSIKMTSASKILQPFIYNEQRRAIAQAELDAIISHLYGLNTYDICYIPTPKTSAAKDKSYSIVSANANFYEIFFASATHNLYICNR